MDPKFLFDRHQRSLLSLDSAATDQERDAHRQFIHDYAVRIRMVRTELGAADAVCGFPTGTDQETI